MVRGEAILPRVPDAEENFPRGRGRATPTAGTAAGGKRRGTDAIDTLEASPSARKKLKTTTKTGRKRVSHSSGEYGGERLELSLRLRDINVDAKVWGCVISVTTARATLALPHGLRGVIEYGGKEKGERREPQSYQVGQLLRCMVLRVEAEKKRVVLTHVYSSVLSLKPGEIVPAFVESEEDHGWTLSFGDGAGKSKKKSGGRKGFLPKHEGKESIEVNSVIDVAVTKVDKRGVVKCSVDKTLLSTQIAQDHSDLSLHDLIPGMLVRATVKSVLPGGLVVTFLSYFTATIEASHLPKMVSEYKVGVQFQTRILYIDQESKSMHLSALDHLLSLDENILANLPKVGTLVESAFVLGIDDKQGLLLKLDYESEMIDGFCHSSNVADKSEEKVSQSFTKGQEVKARVIGYRPMEKIVNVTLKESVLSQNILSHEDVNPGSILTGTVVAVRDFGLIIEVAKNVRGVCPVIHMSDVTSSEPNWGKFKVNSKVKCLVIDCDHSKQRITLSVKRSLVKSELRRISSLDMKLQGTLTHGVITGIESYGIFVTFCGGIKGLAHVSELGLSVNETPESCFDVGQVVKCKIIGVRKSRKQLVLSLQTQSNKQNLEADFKVGTTGSIRVNKILENDIECTFVTNNDDEQDALIHVSHLSDNVSATKILKENLQVDFCLDNVMVLHHGTGSKIRLTRKECLLSIGSNFIKDSSKVTPGDTMYGYIHRIMPNKCIVKFLGGMIGIVPKSQISENFVVDPSNHLCLGQTVCCQVMDISEEDGSLVITLKNEDDLQTKSQLLTKLWKDRDTAYLLAKEAAKEGTDFSKLAVGTSVSCTVNKKKDYGVVCDIDEYSDLLGLITHEHATRQLKEGEKIRATVLDFDKIAGYIDLSMKQDLERTQAEEKVLKVGSNVDAIVQLVHENCLVASIPSLNNAIAFVCFKSVNQQFIDSHEFFTCSQKIKCTVCEGPSEASHQRIILQTKAIKKKALSRKEPKGGKLQPGTWTTGVVESVQPMQISMRLKYNIRARLHITELAEDIDLADLAFGKEMKVRILGWHSIESSHFRHFEVSTRKDTELTGPVLDVDGNEVEQGKEVVGIVQGVEENYLWVVFSRNVRGRLHVLDSASDFAQLKDFQKRFQYGEKIQCKITKADEDLRNIDLTLKKEGKKKKISAGDVLCGVVTNVSELSIQVQISASKFGRIFITDAAVKGSLENPFKNVSIGRILECKVLEVKGQQIILGFAGADARSAQTKVTDFEVGQEVRGYVKNVTPKGCFVSLSRNVHALIRLKNLSNKFIVDPAKEFPKGKCVQGKVIDINEDKKQMEVTLKDERQVQGSVTSVSEGDVLRGRITRLEKFGAFCYFDDKKLTGLIHISELGTDFVKSVASVVGVGDEVEVAVTKVDESKNRIYLTMKGFGVIEDEDELEEGGYGEESDEDDEDAKMEDEIMHDLQKNESDDDVEESDDDLEEKRKVVDDMKASEIVPMETEEEETWTDFDVPKEVSKVEDDSVKQVTQRQGKRKETEVRAAELARINGSAEPSSKADYERLVLVSPNDSYTWISYMAFLLSLREVDEARKVAERALDVINYREQDEKHNVWVAYLNLEFEHGSPPEESAMQLFKRGLPYNDGRKFHLALLSILKEKGMDDMAQQLLTTMCKKFRDSPEIWLASIEYHISQKRDKVASKVMDRSLKSIEDSKEQTKLISQVALLYYKHQYHEQARHMFESILKSYPKRTDLWSIYIDQEIKLKEHPRIKNLFERCVHLQIPVKKMKFIFKKYMDYEMQYGDDESIERVKQKAMAYVQSKM